MKILFVIIASILLVLLALGTKNSVEQEETPQRQNTITNKAPVVNEVQLFEKEGTFASVAIDQAEHHQPITVAVINEANDIYQHENNDIEIQVNHYEDDKFSNSNTKNTSKEISNLTKKNAELIELIRIKTKKMN
ncbi:MAG: hypothetical protein OCD00_03810 [Colwellia sp.]